MLPESKTERLLRLILFLSNSYPKTKGECTSFLGIRDSAFYSYRNSLINTGFDMHQRDGRYWIEYHDKDHQVLLNVLHFSEEEGYILSKSIDNLDENNPCSLHLKQKLTLFLNHDKTIESYIKKEKPAITQALWKAQKEKKQILLRNYASGNSQTVKDRLVEPFGFKDDFNLVWAFDVSLKQNRQFKICRIEDVAESPLDWEYEHQHRSKPVDVFRNTGELNKELECMLTLKARNLLIEEYPLAERYLSKTEGNQYILRVKVAKYEGPGRFVMGLSEDIKPVGDKGFLEYLKEKVKKCNFFYKALRIPESGN
ncbi:MAG: WYL domain-containing protein [Bacteroidales bacterium]